MVDSDVAARMLAQIVNGVSKEDSTVHLDDEHGALWDEMAAEVAEARAAGKIVDIPAEWPETDGVEPLPEAPDTPPSPDTPPAPDAAPADAPPEARPSTSPVAAALAAAARVEARKQAEAREAALALARKIAGSP